MMALPIQCCGNYQSISQFYTTCTSQLLNVNTFDPWLAGQYEKGEINYLSVHLSFARPIEEKRGWDSVRVKFWHFPI